MLPHQFPFDPTYGYDLSSLFTVGAPPEPADFADFWQATYRDALALPPEPELSPSPLKSDVLDVQEITFTSLGGFRTGGWLTTPKNADVTRLVVAGHGYGGRSAPDLTSGDGHTATLFFCARGFHRSARSDVPGEAFRHVVHGITSRDTYLIRFCVADIWAAASALLHLFPHAADRLDYSGVSFGGGLGALALPWDQRFRRAFLGVPTFGNHPLRLTLPCVGSGSALTRLHATNPQIVDVLQYFDAAAAARRIRQPTLVHCALFDPAVPPPGQFAVYNAIPAPKDLLVTRAAHFEYEDLPDDYRRMAEACARWFA